MEGLLQSPKEKILDSILESSYNGIIAIDFEEKIILFNRAAERLTGVAREKAVFQPISRVLPSMGLPEVLKDKTTHTEKLYVNDKVFLANLSPLYLNDVFCGAVGIFQDISDLETIINEVNTYKTLVHQLDAIVESSQDGLYLTDGNGYTLRVNSAYEKMTGFKREELIGKHMSWLVERGMISESVTLQVLKSKSTISRIQNLSNGKDILVTGTPVKDEQGNIIMVMNNATDITHLKALEEELEKARELNETFSEEIAHFRHTNSPDAELVFQSDAMKEIVKLIHQVSLFPTTVLLRGESGVGKEVIASMIHQHSPRSKKPFIKVNCSAIPESLLESELFGYEKGAFSGANRNGKPGLFELASGGTILLDEIGDLPINLQVKLLRVIQERELRRVGGTKSIPIDIRIISATNKNLKQMVENDEFREDLYYRLNVIDIHIPPLRERREDIKPLLAYYMKKYCKDYGILKHIVPETLEYLKSYDWPGNIRELRNLLENLIVSTTTYDLLPAHLPDYMKKAPNDQSPIQSQLSSESNATDSRDASLKQSLEQLEQQLIREALKKHGSIRQAAQSLKIDHSTLIRKMRKLGIESGNA